MSPRPPLVLVLVLVLVSLPGCAYNTLHELLDPVDAERLVLEYRPTARSGSVRLACRRSLDLPGMPEPSLELAALTGLREPEAFVVARGSWTPRPEETDILVVQARTAGVLRGRSVLASCTFPGERIESDVGWSPRRARRLADGSFVHELRVGEEWRVVERFEETPPRGLLVLEGESAGRVALLILGAKGWRESAGALVDRDEACVVARPLAGVLFGLGWVYDAVTLPLLPFYLFAYCIWTDRILW